MIVSMDKVVTIMKEVAANKTAVWTVKYKELEAVLNNINEITADYPFGQMKNRTSKLEKLGFSIKETIFYNDDAPYARIKQVWGR